MNDIWTLPSGEWIVYTDEPEIIKDFKSLLDLEVVTTYHGMFKKHRASQFKFSHCDDLLRYICFKARFDYDRVMRMRKHPGTGEHRYHEKIQQPSLLVEVEPPRRKKSRK